MKKGKIIKSIALSIILSLFTIQVVYAAYSSYGTFEITNDSTSYTTTNTQLSSTKETTSTSFLVYASAKTMTSSPKVRLINSDNEVRSSYVSIADTYTTYTGTNNTGVVGYPYYAEVTPAWNQIGTDTIRLKINAN